MKCLIVLVVLCGAIHLSEQGLTKAQIDEMSEKFVNDCAAKEGATADDIQYLKDRNLPNNRAQKCVAACFSENFALVKAGKIDVDKVIKMAGSLFGEGSPKYEMSKSISMECEDGKDADRCQASTNIYSCVVDSAKKHGFDLKEFI